MKISINQSTLAKYLQILQGIIERKHTIAILSNILVETTDKEVYLVATDLDVGIKIRCKTEISEPGTITIPGRRLNEIVRELPTGKKVEISLKSNNLVNIVSERSECRIVGLPSDDYPTFPSFEGITYYPFPIKQVVEMISQTIFATALDETRSVLNGILLEVNEDNLKMIATDGHRLVIRKMGIKNELNEKLSGESMIIPRKALRELLKILVDTQEDCMLGINENRIIFKTDSIILFSRKITGKFPNYNNVIPTSNDKKFVIDRENFVKSLKRVSLMSDIKSKGVFFQLGENLLTMKSSNPEVGDFKEEVEINYEGENMDIMFNSHYLAEGLGVLKEKEVLFILGGKSSPAMIKFLESDDFIYVVMPMQLDQE